MPMLAVGMLETWENYDMPATMGELAIGFLRKLLDSAGNRGLMYWAMQSARGGGVGKERRRKAYHGL